MYKPPVVYVPTPLEALQAKNPKAQTKGRYLAEVTETMKDGGDHDAKDREWVGKANPDYVDKV